MIVCPDCTVEIGELSGARTPACPTCGRTFESKSGVWDFLPRRSGVDTIVVSYAENYERIAKDDLTESILNDTYSDIQAAKLFGYLSDLAGETVCDLGIGQGRVFSRLLDSKAREVTGVDISPTYLNRFVDTRGRLVLADAEDLPFSHEFDTVVCSDILEHVLNLGDALLSINRSLRVGGRFLVRVPFREDLTHYARKRGCPYQFVHLRTFNRQLLREMLGFAGFKVRSIRYDGFYADRPRLLMSRRPLRATMGLLARAYGDPNRFSSINNALGRLLTKPLEIVAEAIKVTEFEHAP